jgi:hypothetical protein
MYLFLVALGLCVTYFLLYLLFPTFFKETIPAMGRRSLYSLAVIVGLSVLVFAISFAIRDSELSNRVLHIFGGGFLSFLICFIVVKDTKLQIDRLQFFVFSFLVVISLGAVNEMLEYFLQNYFNFSFAKTANDTWLDLISNSVGALIAAVILVPFIKNNQNKIF